MLDTGTKHQNSAILDEYPELKGELCSQCPLIGFMTGACKVTTLVTHTIGDSFQTTPKNLLALEVFPL